MKNLTGLPKTWADTCEGRAATKDLTIVVSGGSSTGGVTSRNGLGSEDLSVKGHAGTIRFDGEHVAAAERGVLDEEVQHDAVVERPQEARCRRRRRGGRLPAARRGIAGMG